jgi:hypothetical protein
MSRLSMTLEGLTTKLRGAPLFGCFPWSDVLAANPQRAEPKTLSSST